MSFRRPPNKLVFYECNFGNLDDSLKLNPEVFYNFTKVNFYGSFRNNLDNYEKLMAAFAQTNLKDSQLDIHVDKENFSMKFTNRLAIKSFLLDATQDKLKRAIYNIKTYLETGFVANKRIDGSIYSGGWLDSKKHGLGKIEYMKDYVFTGLFQNGLYHGYG